MQPLPPAFKLERTILEKQHCNEVTHISLRMSERIAKLRLRPICEVRELPDRDKAFHIVSDPEMQKFFLKFHRYGPKVPQNKDVCPFGPGKVRDTLIALSGEHNLATTFAEESVAYRKILAGFFTSEKQQELKIKFKIIAMKWLDIQFAKSEVLLFDASLCLVGECLIAAILGYETCRKENVEGNVAFWKTLLHPLPNEQKSLVDLEEDASVGLIGKVFSLLQDGPSLASKLWLLGTSNIDNLCIEIYQNTVAKEGSLAYYLHTQRYTESVILEHIKGLLIAGQESTGYLLGFLLYEYARNGKMQCEHAQSSEGLKNAYLEALRLYSLAGSQREAASDLLFTYPDATNEADYKQHYIRKGDVIVCTPYMPGRCAKLWDKPERFDPERPALERTKQTPHFGYGPHRCIGEKVAKIEILTLLEVILQQATLQTNDTLPELLEAFTLRPERDVKVVFSKRSNCL